MHSEAIEISLTCIYKSYKPTIESINFLSSYVITVIIQYIN